MAGARRIWIGLALVLIGAGLVWGLLRVQGLQAREVAHASKPRPLVEVTTGDGPHLLTSASLAEGAHVVFEVCVGDGLAPERWAGRATFDVWFEPAEERVLVTELDAAFFGVVRRGGGRACAKIGEAPELGMGGEYAVGMTVVDPTLRDDFGDVGVQARILARPALADADRIAVWITTVGALLLAVVLVLGGRRAGQGSDAGGGLGPTARVAIGMLAFFAVTVGAGLVPLQGSTAGFVRGLVLAGVQVGLAVGLVASVRSHRADALALVRPAGGAWMLLAALAAGVIVWLAGGWLGTLIPSTGRAPIETFVSFPSGRLAYGTLAVVIPVAEELFFRGFVYGTLDRRFGANVATLATIVLFSAVHLPQQWGAWGPVASVVLTGIVLTLLRRYTRSTSVPAAAHVLHNALNTLLALG